MVAGLCCYVRRVCCYGLLIVDSFLIRSSYLELLCVCELLGWSESRRLGKLRFAICGSLWRSLVLVGALATVVVVVVVAAGVAGSLHV